MRKTVIYQKRRAESDRHTFVRWALDAQPSLIRRIGGLASGTVCTEAEGKDETFDVATELRFADPAALASAPVEQLLAAMRANASRIERVDLVEHPFVDTGAPAPYKLMAALKRRADLTRADFRHWWLVKHAPFVVEFEELRRYQVNIVEDGPEAFVDGIAEVCFADLAALQRVMSRGHVKEVQEDSQRHTQARCRMFVEEHVIP